MTSAAPPDSILGTWKLRSWVREIIATGKREDFFGEKPDGYLCYSSDARMQAILIADNRIKPNSVAPADEDKLKLYNTMLSYGGTYKIEGDKVVHSIDISWNQTLTGTELVRFYKRDGDTLTMTAPIQKSIFDDQEIRAVLVFEKVQ